MNPILIPIAVVAIIAALLLFMSLRVIPNNRIGIVEKRFSARGSVTSGFIALNGEAGFQPNVLRGGWHFLVPFQYVVHMAPLVTIPQGKIGYVFARDGAVLGASQALASNRLGSDFTDVVGFLKNFCADKNAKVDYKDQSTLKYFVTERGKIIPRRISGNCALHQRAVAKSVKQSRGLALIPYLVLAS